MKRLIETDEQSGFEAMLDEKITLYCGIYIYTGRVTGVNADHIELAEPMLVYETGCLNSDVWKDAQKLPEPHRVMIQSIESWGPAKC
jgi:hypothetical protein